MIGVPIQGISQTRSPIDASAEVETVPGHRSISIPVDHHEQPLDGAIWYPTMAHGATARVHGNAVFEPVAAQPDAPPADGRRPVVLLSHGLGGHFRSLSWLGAGLVHGTRVADLSAALDHVQGDATWGERIDTSRLFAAGFSYGGWTALSMGGLRGNLAGYTAHCAEVADASSHCADIARAGVALDSLDAQRWDADYRDERLAGVVAIDPGLIHGLEPADANDVIETVRLISLGQGDDRLLATDYDLAGLTTLLPGAVSDNIAPAAHFSVLPICTPAGPEILKQERDDPVCDEPAGGDRADVHARLIEAVAAVFEPTGPTER